MSNLLPLTPEEAVKAVVAQVGTPPPEGKYVAQRLGDSVLNCVSVHDAQARGFPHVWAGGGWLIGPDAQVFALSSNPGIHDWDLAARLLERLYLEGLAHRVEPSRFAERLQTMTEQREAMVRDFLDDARGGSLRSSTRVLP